MTMSSAPAEAPPTTRRFAYLVTLQWHAEAGSRSATYAGSAAIPEGVSRSAATAWAIEQARESLSASADAVVLFFSLEPDDLPRRLHVAAE
jgi:hypothetical protein